MFFSSTTIWSTGASTWTAPSAFSAAAVAGSLPMVSLTFFAAEHLGGDDRGDADEAERLPGRGHVPDQPLDVGVHLKLHALGGEGAEVLRRAVAAGKDERVEVLGLHRLHVDDGAAGDAGRLVRARCARSPGAGSPFT